MLIALVLVQSSADAHLDAVACTCAPQPLKAAHHPRAKLSERDASSD